MSCWAAGLEAYCSLISFISTLVIVYPLFPRISIASLPEIRKDFNSKFSRPTPPNVAGFACRGARMQSWKPHLRMPAGGRAVGLHLVLAKRKCDLRNQTRKVPLLVTHCVH